MDERQIVTKCEDSCKNRIQGASSVHVSNEYASLKNFLVENLQSPQPSSPFRKLIVTPTHTVQTDLLQSITDRSKVLFGLRFLNMPQLIEHLSKLSLPPHIRPRFPNARNLALHIEAEIHQLLSSQEAEIAPLTDYIQNKNSRIRSLSQEMSHVFLHYGLYGSETLLDWQRKAGWQQTLWHRLKSYWDFPCQLLNAPHELSIPLDIHLFLPNHIPKLYRHFLDQLESSANLHYYLLSPTDLYWGDLIPEDRAAKFDLSWQKRGARVEERSQFAAWQEEINPLLANYCSYAQPVFDYLMDKEVTEEYVEPKGESLLGQIQSSIFSMERAEEGFSQDNSVLLHEAPNTLREVEILLHNLQTLYNEKPFRASDVLVFAPDIEVYLPYIELVFGGDDLFGYHISKVKRKPPNSTLTTIRNLFALVGGRFEPKSIFQLFTSPSFLEKTPFQPEDLSEFESRISEQNVRFGFDGTDREEILDSENISDLGSWRFAFDEILRQLPYSTSTISLSFAEKMGEFMAFIEKLHHDIRSMHSVKHDLQGWIEIIAAIVQDYFTIDDECLYFLREISRMSELTSRVDHLFPFSSIQPILFESIDSYTYDKHCQKGVNISFNSIQEGMIPQIDHLFVLGLDEESFPRNSTYRSINELKGEKGVDHQFGLLEKDRYFFLQSILSAKKSLHYSYLGQSSLDGKQLGPSLFLRDLMDHLGCNLIKKHPPFSFSREIMQGEHFSPLSYQIAKAYYSHSCENEIPPRTDIEEPPSTDIPVHHLVKLARAPLQLYCNENLGIYYERNEEEKHHFESEFTLTYLDRALYTRETLYQDRSRVIDDAKKQAALPTAMLESVAIKELNESMDSLEENLHLLGIEQDAFFSLILHHQAKETTRENKRVITPNVQLEVHDKTYFLYGEIDLLTDKGLFTFGEESFAEIWKMWPKLLVVANALPESPLTLLFGKSGSAKTIQIDNPKGALSSYIEYYLESLHHPSPLLPHCVESYLRDDLERFEKQRAQLPGLFPDPYHEKVDPKVDHPWKNYMKEVCKALIV